jgi:hypothetical protein
MAEAALEQIGVVGAVLRDDGGLNGVADPAPSALEMSPERRLEIENALHREVRRLQRRLYFQYAQLRCLKFIFQTKAAALEGIRNLNRLLHQCCRCFHRARPLARPNVPPRG